MPISYRFRDKLFRFQSKSQIFPTHVGYFAPPLKGVSKTLEIGHRRRSGSKKNYWVEKEFDDIFNRLDTIYERNGRTDIGRQQLPRLRIASRGNFFVVCRKQRTVTEKFDHRGHPASHPCYRDFLGRASRSKHSLDHWMLYRIRNGLVAIYHHHFKQTTVATRRHETRYMQIRCNSCMYSQTFFPSAVRLWNRAPSDTCYLAPDSFKLELSKINLI